MTTIDERVVAMRFQNGQFESGIRQTMSSLASLKKGLDMQGATKGLEGVGAAAKNLTLDGVSASIERVNGKFLALATVGVTAISRITSAAMAAGGNLLKSLTLDPILDGYREYETQMNSIQTILANTQSAGTTLSDVSKSLDELNAYADQTIYNFTEMTKSIGTFTAAGVDLETSTAAIKGFSNVAAVAGANSQSTSVAMYQLSQAMSTGQFRLMDWMSIENAGISTQVFRDSLIETARVHGVAIDDMIKKAGSFRNSLSEEWLTADIMNETLQKFTGDLTDAQLKSMGYTSAQIKDIQKMAKTALDAATKVKTMTQLIGTLQEAVGSGWAQSSQIVFGNFEEAKAMYTDVANVLGEMIGNSADARNKMLKDWKELGGRTALIDAISNTFHALMSVIKPISQAFRDIFPRTTGKQLADMTKSLRDFTAGLELSGPAADALRNTFKGLFAIFSIVGTVMGQLIRYFADTFALIFSGGSSLVYLTGGFGEVLAAVDEFLKKGNYIEDFFTKLLEGRRAVLEPLIGFIKALAKAFGTLISGDFAGFKEQFIGSFEELAPLAELAAGAIDKISTGFQKVRATVEPIVVGLIAKVNELTDGALAPLGEFVSNLSEKFGEIRGAADGLSELGVAASGAAAGAGALSSVGSGLASAWQWVVDAFQAIVEASKPVIQKVKEVIGGATSALQEWIGSLTFTDLVALFNTVLVTGLLVGARNLFKQMKNIFEAPADMLENVNAVLEGLTEALQAFTLDVKAGALLKIAIAIGILAISVAGLSMIDPKKMTNALLAISIMFTQLGIALNFLSTSITQPGIAKLPLVALSLMLLAGAIAALSAAVAILGMMDPAALAKGLIGTATLLGSLAIFTKVAEANQMGMAQSAGLILLAVAINLLAVAVGKIGNMDVGTIVKGMATITAMMAGLTAMAKILNGTSGMVQAAAGMAIMAGSLLLLSFALKQYAAIDVTTFLTGMSMIGIAILGISGAMQTMPKNLPALASGLLLVGAALLMISGAMKILGGMDTEGLVAATLALGVALLSISLAVQSMQGAVTGAAAILIVAAALNMLVPALVTLGSLDLSTIGVGLLAMAGIFLVLGLAGYALTPVVPTLLLLGVAMGLMGAAALMAGAGMALFAVGLTAAAAAGGIAVTVLLAALAGVIGMIPFFMEQLGLGIRALAKVISESGPEITAALTTLVMSLLNAIDRIAPKLLDSAVRLIKVILTAIVRVTPMIVQAAIKLVMALVNGIISLTGKLVNAATRLITGFLNGIAASIGPIARAGANIIIQFLNAMQREIPRIVDAGYDMIIGVIDGVANSIRANQPRLDAAMRNLADAAIQAFLGSVSNVSSIGGDIVRGIANGILGGLGTIASAARTAAGNALAAAKNALGIHSPSREFYKLGVFVNKGFANGLKGNSRESVVAAYSSMKDMLTDMIRSSRDDIKEYTARLKDLEKRKKEVQKRDADTAKERNKKAEDLKRLNKAINKTEKALTKARKEGNAALGARNKLLSQGGYAKGNKGLVDEQRKLKALASEYERTTKKLEAAQQKLSDAIKTRDDYKKSIKDQYSEITDITEETTLKSYLEDMTQKIEDTNEFATKLQKLRSLGLNDNVYKELLEKGPDALPFIDSVLKSGKSGVLDINALSKDLDKASSSLGYNASKNLYQAGVDAARGVVNGLKKERDNIDKEMERIASKMVSAIKKKLKIKSPSRVLMEVGKFTNQGLIKGLEQTSDNVAKAGVGVADGALNAMRNSLSKMGEEINSNMDTNPTIRPVLDLTDVQNGSSALSTLLANHKVSATASYSKASMIAEEARSMQDAMAQMGDDGRPNVSFTQNNYSPKALSSAEIFRQTRNQISKVKEGLR